MVAIHTFILPPSLLSRLLFLFHSRHLQLSGYLYKSSRFYHLLPSIYIPWFPLLGPRGRDLASFHWKTIHYNRKWERDQIIANYADANAQGNKVCLTFPCILLLRLLFTKSE